MQFIQVTDSMKLTDLAQIVGYRNIDHVLHINGISRCPDIGKAFLESAKQTIATSAEDTDPVDSQGKPKDSVIQRMKTVLNTFTSDSDIFEEAALLDSDGWKMLSARNTFPDKLRVPDSIQIPRAANILGNGQHVGRAVYKQAMYCLTSTGLIDPGIFNEYSTIKPYRVVDDISQTNIDVFQWFPIPWGDVSLYSSISGDMLDFPVYPEELSESTPANYTQMPELLYQYEPWQLYQSSGPRQITYTFHFHRDMWTGDHRDGKANELIRFCEANCFPQYNGSAVNIPMVTMYIKGQPMITGVVTEVSKDWAGPLGLDGFYLECTLSISITEISRQPLNYTTVRRLPLIG